VIEMTLEQALRKAYQLGQIYWQQADSESYKENKKSFETSAKFDALLQDTIDAHIAKHADLEESNKLLRSAAQKNVLATAELRQRHAELIAQLTFDVRVEQGLREFAEKKHAEMARDVARYRWLRKRLEVTRNGAVPDCISMEHWRVEDSKSPDDATYVDETIDAAMTGESP
jgi:hypothetical protein